MAETSFKASIWLLKAEQNAESVELEDSYVQLLNHHGYTTQLFPVLSFTFQNLNGLRDVAQTPESFAGIIFTSPRSVEALHQATKEGTWIESWRGKRSYCVGAKTFDAAQILLGLTCVGADCGNAENLAYLIQQETNNIGLPYLFPCSSMRRDVLPAIMAQNHISLVEIQAYNTIPHPDLERLMISAQATNQWPDFLVFFSPSGVQYAKPVLDHLKCPWSEMKIISLGPSTSSALLKSNLKVIAECQKPCPEALLEVLSC